jgi:hypothetical protein
MVCGIACINLVYCTVANLYFKSCTAHVVCGLHNTNCHVAVEQYRKCGFSGSDFGVAEGSSLVGVTLCCWWVDGDILKDCNACIFKGQAA